MARYGDSLYAAAFLGDVSPNLFHAEVFTARETGYGDVTLQWSTPGGDWQTLRLLRNQNGYPTDENNGILIYETAVGVDAGRFVDHELLVDRWVYYSLFVFNEVNNVWIRSGNARVYVPEDFGGGERMYYLLPAFYRNGLEYDTTLMTDPVTRQLRSVNPLATFISVLGYQYDLWRNALNSTLDLYDSARVCYDLIPAMLKQFGIEPEPEIGPEQYRRLLRNAVFLYQTKGSRTGVHGMVAAVTGWDSRIRAGTNLMWDADHSDFIGGVGFWSAGAVNAQVVWQPETPQQTSAMRMVALEDGDLSTTFVTTETVQHLGILVLPLVDYNVSVTLAAGGSEHAPAHVSVDWYDKNGNYLVSDVSGPTPTTQSDQRIEFIATAPADAVRLGVSIVVTDATAGSWWLVKHVQVNRNAALQPAEPGRDIHITLRGQRRNLVYNGSFEGGLQRWAAGGDATLDLDDTRAFTQAGERSAKLTYTGPGLAATDPAVDLPRASTEFETVPGIRYVLQLRLAAEQAGAVASARAHRRPRRRAGRWLDRRSWTDAGGGHAGLHALRVPLRRPGHHDQLRHLLPRGRDRRRAVD